MEKATRRARGVVEAEMRQTGAESRAETRAETRAERERAGRYETQRGRETQNETENTSNFSLKLELVRRSLLYIEKGQRPRDVAREAVSTSTPTGAVRGAHLAPLVPLTGAARAHERDCIRRARVTTSPTVRYTIFI